MRLCKTHFLPTSSHFPVALTSNIAFGFSLEKSVVHSELFRKLTPWKTGNTHPKDVRLSRQLDEDRALGIALLKHDVPVSLARPSFDSRKEGFLAFLTEWAPHGSNIRCHTVAVAIASFVSLLVGGAIVTYCNSRYLLSYEQDVTCIVGGFLARSTRDARMLTNTPYYTSSITSPSTSIRRGPSSSYRGRGDRSTAEQQLSVSASALQYHLSLTVQS